ncbi:hypothetical protein NQ318_004384 [Aromia moschata]|uniref:Glutathione S-transferase n=1 Tax=Aromia moschata TaxID=1265417 RepID=A0AAV8YTR9_9CUCU|nr:hypothetical protein NQ318_004384 [Aromia moschata]
MAPKLHYAEISPAVRASLLAVKALGIQVDLNPVDLTAHDHLTPEFLRLNPMHTVPTLEDGDFAIWDSHAINAYLTEKYGKDDALYPKDLQKRAVVNQRMYFDCGILFPRLLAIVVPIFRQGVTSTLLERSTYVAGEELSLADFSIVATVTTSNILVPIEAQKFPKITEYVKRMQALPYYAEANQDGLDKFEKIMKSKLA